MTAAEGEEHARLELQAEMLANRLRKRQRALSKWARKEGISAWRVYHRDIPEIPLTIDWYDGHLLVSEFVTRRREDGEAGDRALERLAEAAGAALGVPTERIYTKLRKRQKGASQYERQGDSGERFAVGEFGLRLLVNLSDYLDTGLFLDHRETRRMVAAEAEGRRVLNLFSYTGAFTVHAAAAGARESVSIDMSATYLAWAEANLRENRLDEGAHVMLRDDVLAWLRHAVGRVQPFDLVVCDPPTFSTSKRMEGTLDLQRDHVGLLRDVVAITRPGGVVYFSTNRRGFSLDPSAFSGCDFEEITARTIPQDFRGTDIHRAWRAVRHTGRSA
ncbi:MAG: class I SAM-dependent methyltransferase [Myxococcota bacterium]